jgi:hypothetical protein
MRITIRTAAWLIPVHHDLLAERGGHRSLRALALVSFQGARSSPARSRGRRFPTTLGLSCARNMLPLGREVQAERRGTLPAYRVRCKLWLGLAPASTERLPTPYCVCERSRALIVSLGRSATFLPWLPAQQQFPVSARPTP